MTATTARSVINDLIPARTYDTASQRIRAATPCRIHWYLPKGDLNLNRQPPARFSRREWRTQGSAARGGQMAGNLRVHAYVVERTGRDRGDDVAGVGAVVRRRAVVSAPAGRDRADDQPYQHNEPSDSHLYLRQTSSSYPSAGSPAGRRWRRAPAPFAGPR